ncbi:MAG: hypothetical protein HQK51_20940 [Oligoflexia bacterium]|nr:hypothetical protein [Oligoflexia bacterium]
MTLNRLSRRRITKLMKSRRPLFEGSPWTIAIIVDSTLHQRSYKTEDEKIAEFFN